MCENDASNAYRAIEDKTDWQVFASGEDFLESLDD